MFRLGYCLFEICADFHIRFLHVEDKLSLIYSYTWSSGHHIAIDHVIDSYLTMKGSCRNTVA